MSDLDKFLSAPDSVRKNETERKKYLLRKAKAEAEAEREKNSKSPDDASIEDLLADLIRCAEDPETNPFYKDRTLSAKRYKRFGNYLMEEIDREFGQFEHAKQVAGLMDQPGTRTWKASRAQASRREHAGRYQDRYMHPNLYRPSERELHGVESILSISDTHATFLDPFTWWCFLRAILHLEPDIVYLNGDILEGGEISRYPKIPGWTVSLQLEFDFAREMFRQIREVAPDCELIWGAGNHGLDRLAMYLTQVAPALSGLRALRFDQLAGVDEFGVKLAQGGSIASPEGTEDQLPGTLFHDSYLIHHGTCLGVTPYLQELRSAQYSGQSGHVHRAGLAYSTTEQGGAKSWMSTPMGCVPRAGRAYIKNRNTGWQTGFGVAFLHSGGRVHQYPVVTSEGFASCEGLMFENPGLPEPDPQKLWLPDFKL